MFDNIKMRRIQKQIQKQVVPDVNVTKMRKRFQRLGDAEALTMLEAFVHLREDAAQAVYEDRQRIVRVLEAEQGNYGPDDRWRGYYEGYEDAIDTVIKGQ